MPRRSLFSVQQDLEGILPEPHVNCIVDTLQLKRLDMKACKDAVFFTAAVWLWNSNLETGNFVPEGEFPLKPSKMRMWVFAQ